MKPSQRLLIHFRYEHLPEHLIVISKPFNILAHQIDNLIADGPEKTVALRKLLEAKDCAVRAKIEEGYSGDN